MNERSELEANINIADQKINKGKCWTQAPDDIVNIEYTPKAIATQSDHRTVVTSHTLVLPKGNVEIVLVKLEAGSYVVNIIRVSLGRRKFINQYKYDTGAEALVAYRMRVALMVHHSS